MRLPKTWAKLGLLNPLTIRTRLGIIALLLFGASMMGRISDLNADRDRQIAAAKNELSLIASRIASSQHELFVSVESFLKTAAFVYVRSVKRGAGCGLIDAGLPVEANRITNFSIFGEDGIVKCSTLPSIVGMNGNGKPYFDKAMATSQVTVSDFILSKGKNEPSVLVTFPIQVVDPQVRGTIMVSVGAKWLLQILESSESRPGITVFLLDSRATVLATKSKQRELVGLPFPEPNIVNAILGADQGTVFDGNDDHYSFAKIPGTESRVVVGINEAVMLAPINQDISRAYRHMFGIALLILLGGWGLTEWLILRPIREIANAAYRSAEGGQHPRVGTRRLPPEFKSLALAFNAMADAFETRQEHLETVNSHLNVLSMRDPLSNLLNRRALDAALEEAWRDAQRKRIPLALMMIDVDRFKQFNDRYGHIEGDHCLRKIGVVLNTIAKAYDGYAARYGGEEFAFVLPFTSAGRALEVAEFIRLAIQGLAIEHADSSGGCVTVSIGLKMSNANGVSRLEKLIAGADENLYAAKHQGRNLVVNDQRFKTVISPALAG